ncbi:MAG TPA: response regulator [Fimbriiglobus sp.]|jgi:CheY-like chemotaxis protein|nr:response regulator [Fimbriiglobus sp.]
MPTVTTCRVLCVDDNRDAASSLAYLLGVVGYEARACFDGPSALAEAAEFRPHVCMLDINMPEMDGYELARRLRGLLGQPLLVAVTAVTGADFERRATEAGFDRWFTKPANPLDLIATLPRDDAPAI